MGHGRQAPPLRSPALHHSSWAPRWFRSPTQNSLGFVSWVSSQIGIHVQENPRTNCLEKYLIELLPMLMCVLICFSHVWLFVTLRPIAFQVALSMDFPSKNTGLGCHSPGDGPNPGIEPMYPATPVLQMDSWLLSHQGSLISPIVLILRI